MTRLLLVGTVAITLLSGCAHDSSTQAAAPPPASAQAPTHADMMAACPMSVPGTQVAATDAMNGETLTFTTSELVGAPVAELQHRVKAMADMHNQRHAGAGASGATASAGTAGGSGSGSGEAAADGTMATGDTTEASRRAMPPSRATVHELPNGASLTLTANAPADVEQLQAAVRRHAQYMQLNGCAMGQAHGG